MRAFLSASGRLVLRVLRGAGAYALLAGRLLIATPRMDGREWLRTVSIAGVDALPLCLVTAALTGALVVIQTGFYVESYGVTSLVGWGVGYALFHEFAPLIASLALSGRVGAGQASDIAGLRAGEQLPALEALGVDIDRALLAPRFWAIAASVVVLAVIADVVALSASLLVAVGLLGVPPGAFLASVHASLRVADAVPGIVKAAAFGLALGACSLRAGLAAPAEARGVGAAARRSLVATLTAILALDMALTGLL